MTELEHATLHDMMDELDKRGGITIVVRLTKNKLADGGLDLQVAHSFSDEARQQHIDEDGPTSLCGECDDLFECDSCRHTMLVTMLRNTTEYMEANP